MTFISKEINLVEIRSRIRIQVFFEGRIRLRVNSNRIHNPGLSSNNLFFIEFLYSIMRLHSKQLDIKLITMFHTRFQYYTILRNTVLFMFIHRSSVDRLSLFTRLAVGWYLEYPYERVGSEYIKHIDTSTSYGEPSLQSPITIGGFFHTYLSILFTPVTECAKIYRKSVLHLRKYRFAVYLSRCGTDLR